MGQRRLHEVFQGQLATSAESQWKCSRKDFAQEGCLLGQEDCKRKNLERECRGQELMAELQVVRFRAPCHCQDMLYNRHGGLCKGWWGNKTMFEEHTNGTHNRKPTSGCLTKQRAHMGRFLKKLKKQAFVPFFMFILLCSDLWGDRVGGGWGRDGANKTMKQATVT